MDECLRKFRFFQKSIDKSRFFCYNNMLNGLFLQPSLCR